MPTKQTRQTTIVQDMLYEPPRSTSLADLARRLRQGSPPTVAHVCGRDGEGRVDRLLDQLRGHGVALLRRDVAAAPGCDDEVLVLFSHGPMPVPQLWRLARRVRPAVPTGVGSGLAARRAQPIAMLLPAVQSARMAARRLDAGPGPALQGGVRVAAGDVNGDYSLWRTNFGSAGAASPHGFDVIVDGRIITAD